MNAPINIRVEAVDVQIAALDDMDLRELRLRWVELVKAADGRYPRRASSNLPSNPP